MAITQALGDLLAAPTDAIVNPVNTRGAMGKGLALQVKRTWPEVDQAYRAAAANGQVVVGTMHVVDRGVEAHPRFVINFPTKDHWRDPSRIEFISTGLTDLRAVLDRLAIGSIAIPALGCGLGGLSWEEVRPLIEDQLGDLPDVDVVLYPPQAGALTIGHAP